MPTIQREQSGFPFPLMYRAQPMGAVRFTRNNTLALISSSIFQILMTVPGERQTNPEFGCRARMLLFDGATSSTKETLRSLVYEALHRWEPRIELEPEDVMVTESFKTSSTYTVKVTYTVKSPGLELDPQTLTVNY